MQYHSAPGVLGGGQASPLLYALWRRSGRQQWRVSSALLRAQVFQIGVKYLIRCDFWPFPGNTRRRLTTLPSRSCIIRNLIRSIFTRWAEYKAHLCPPTLTSRSSAHHALPCEMIRWLMVKSQNRNISHLAPGPKPHESQIPTRRKSALGPTLSPQAKSPHTITPPAG